jgi:uncharacterized protein (TIGR03437 family)
VRKHYFCLAFTVCCVVRGDNVILGSGSTSNHIPIAPGQILTFTVEGVGASLTQTVSAGSLPLPTKLAGISVDLDQYLTTGTAVFHLPIVTVAPIACVFNGVSNCPPVTAITAQIPYEINVSAAASAAGQIIVSENGVAGSPISALPATDQIQIVAVVHAADWSQVGGFNPATSGENLVAFAYGLGAVQPSAPTGGAAPNPPAIPTGQLRLSYDVRPNVPPWAYGAAATLPAIQPSFVGLTPGFPGLYQINFQAPPITNPNFAPCVQLEVPPNIVFNSNVTLNLLGPSSSGGFGICMIAQP